MAASVNSTDVYDELFAQGTQPQYYCNVHGDGSLMSGMSGGIGGLNTNPEIIQNQGQGRIQNPDNSQTQNQAPDQGQPSGTGGSITIWNTDSNVDSGDGAAGQGWDADGAAGQGLDGADAQQWNEDDGFEDPVQNSDPDAGNGAYGQGDIVIITS
jgi:hypothetical protein